MGLLTSDDRIFLPADTVLMVSVNPDREIAPELQKHLKHLVQVIAPRREWFVRVKLLEDLKIKFTVHQSGNISRDLQPCRCAIPALPHEDIRSLNQAYQKISAAIEPSRISVGGRVYDNVYYRGSNEVWRPLDERREEVYQPYKAKFEKLARKIKENGQEEKGIRIPDGNCILIRETSPQPSLFFPSEIREILGGALPFDECQNLIVFGPLDDKTFWSYIHSIEVSGRAYGKDYIHFRNSLPEWCHLKVLTSSEAINENQNKAKKRSQ